MLPVEVYNCWIVAFFASVRFVGSGVVGSVWFVEIVECIGSVRSLKVSLGSIESSS